jgi:splicing factor 3B subunit 2
MQRYGPPPSYPGLQIPGLTAPIPEGAAYGYHAGGWGKPPVDESGNPLYGNAFGTAQEASVAAVPEEMRAPWGALEEDDFSDDSESEEQLSGEEFLGGDSDLDAEDAYDGGAPSDIEGAGAPAATMDLRKAEPGPQGPLYKVLDMRKTTIGTSAAMGSEHGYVIPPAASVGGVEGDQDTAGEPPPRPGRPAAKQHAPFKF